MQQEELVELIENSVKNKIAYNDDQIEFLYFYNIMEGNELEFALNIFQKKIQLSREHIILNENGYKSLLQYDLYKEKITTDQVEYLY